MSMKRTITTAVLLLSAAGAFAQVRVVSEIAVPSSPAAAAAGASPLSAAAPSLAPAALTPSLAASIATPAPAPVAAPAAAPAALHARASLIQAGAALAAASKGDGDPAAVSRGTFDAAAAKAPASADPVAGSERPHTAALEGADYARRFRVEKPEPPLKKAAWETVEVGAMTLPFLAASAILRANASDLAILLPALAAIWGVGYWAMRSHLAGLRSTVVGGWQASHDQKYRTDPATGRLKDIRGHKYGEDRYEEYAPGPVGRAASLVIGGAAVLGAAAFLLL